MGSGRQVLVYQMAVELDAELAMILPIPVPEKAPDDALRFIDLSAQPGFFRELENGFPKHEVYARSRLFLAAAAKPERPKLKVHGVGAFEASFVPTTDDFDRLDERFRLPKETWDALPQYADFGFAVFKLRKKAGFFSRLFGKKQTFHPMAFEFPRRDANEIFFPTVHVHDGVVHDTAEFDHTLYLQPDAAIESRVDWERSEKPARAFVHRPEGSEPIVDDEAHVFRAMIDGQHKNRDAIVHGLELCERTERRERLMVRWYNHDREVGILPDVPTWARDLPAEKRRVIVRLADELESLIAQNDAWQVAPHDPFLQRLHARMFEMRLPPGFHIDPEPASRPCRIDVSLRDDRLAPYTMLLTLSFPKLPPVEVVKTIEDHANRILTESLA